MRTWLLDYYYVFRAEFLKLAQKNYICPLDFDIKPVLSCPLLTIIYDYQLIRFLLDFFFFFSSSLLDPIPSRHWRYYMPEFSRTIIGLFQKRAATEQVCTIIDGRFFRVKAFFYQGRFTQWEGSFCVQSQWPYSTMDYSSRYVNRHVVWSNTWSA